MEYLSRLMKSLHGDQGFLYHPKCAEIKLTHLVFAENLLLFCKGTLNSIEKMMEKFDTYSRASGLKANLQKSEMNCAGVKKWR